MKNNTYVYIHLNGGFLPAGVMETYEEKRAGYSTFRYGKRYLTRPNAVPIDPITLPLSEIEYNTPEYLKLFGAIRDASPDSWGRKVMDKETGRALTEYEYLVGASLNRIGALGFGPDSVSGPKRMGIASEVSLELDLNGLVMEARSYMENEKDLEKRLAPFIEYGTAFGGARPKALANYDGLSWVAKFEEKEDRRAETKIEFANMLLAGKCGIDIPEVRHITVSSGHNVLLVKRFDRITKDDVIYRKHFTSGLSMLNESETYVIQIDPEKHSYASIADIIRRYGCADIIKDDQLELFRRMIFNIFCSNGDDHLRNHGFLYDHKNHGWHLSPCYDVVPDINPHGLLGLGIGPFGRQASIKNALEGCHMFGLEVEEALHVIENTHRVIQGWQKHFSDCGVSENDIQKLTQNFHLAENLDMDH